MTTESEEYSAYECQEAADFLKNHPKLGELGLGSDRDKWIKANKVRKWYERKANQWGGLFSY